MGQHGARVTVTDLKQVRRHMVVKGGYLRFVSRGLDTRFSDCGHGRTDRLFFNGLFQYAVRGLFRSLLNPPKVRRSWKKSGRRNQSSGRRRGVVSS